jgi:hypothetical protein
MGFLISAIIGRIDFAIRGLVIAIPGIVAALLLKYTYNNEIGETDVPLTFKKRTLLFLFIILYSLSLIVVLLSSTRPIYYFIIMALLYTTIIFQIFSKNSNPNMILFEIVLCMLNVIYSVTLKYPLYFGGTDILLHLLMAEVTFLSGHTIPEELSVGYTSFPLFHILLSQASHLLNLDIKTSYFLISAPIFTISTIFVYYLFKSTTGNTKLSLLTVVFFSNLGTVINSGMYMVTRVAAFVGFIMLMYLIYKNAKNHKPELKLLGILITIFIVLVHQVSTPQILSIMIFILISEFLLVHFKYINPKFHKNSYMPLLFVIFIGYWLYVAYSFTSLVINTRIDSLSSKSIEIKGTVQSGNEWIFLAQNIDTMIIVLLILFGIGITLWKYNKTYSAVFALFTLFILPFYIPNPLQTLWQTMTLFRFDRYMLIISPFIAFSMAMGFLYFQYCGFFISKYRKKQVISLLIIFVVIGFIFPSLLYASPENNDLNSDRRYFTNSELTGFNFVFNYIPNNSNLFTDYYTNRYFSHSKFNESDTLNLPYYRNNYIKEIDNINLHGGYFILNNKRLSENELLLNHGGPSLKLTKHDLLGIYRFHNEINHKNKIYTDWDITIHTDNDYYDGL